MKFIRKFIFSFTLCMLVWGTGLVWFVEQIPSEPSHDTQKADAIVVLTGGSKRIEHGLMLLATNKAQMLFVSGVGKHSTLDDLLHHTSEEIPSNIDSKRVVLGHDAENTIGNAEEINEWLQLVGYKTIYLVTSNYHIPRSLSELQEITPDVAYIPSPVFPDDFFLNKWWEDPGSRNLVLLEYHKFLASKLRHWFMSVTHDL